MPLSANSTSSPRSARARRLAGQGLLTRERSLPDSRSVRLTATDGGHWRIAQWRDLRAEWARLRPLGAAPAAAPAPAPAVSPAAAAGIVVSSALLPRLAK